MPKLDQIISEVNGDLQDCLAPVRDRFRQAMSEIFDYAVANPAQGAAATAQAAISTAFKVHYPDGLVSPGVTIEQAVTAFNNRHGGTGTANEKWVTIRDFIVARTNMRTIVLGWLEEGSIPSLSELWFLKIAGDGLFNEPVSDLVYSETRNNGVLTTNPAYNLWLVRTWSSSSLGKTFRRTYSYDISSGIAITSITDEVL